MNKFKYVIIFACILILGGILSVFCPWDKGIFSTNNPMTIVSGVLMIVGFLGAVWQLIKLDRKA